MVAHHTYGGCNLRPGDVLGTGTISSPVRASGINLSMAMHIWECTASTRALVLSGLSQAAALEQR